MKSSHNFPAKQRETCLTKIKSPHRNVRTLTYSVYHLLHYRLHYFLKAVGPGAELTHASIQALENGFSFINIALGKL